MPASRKHWVCIVRMENIYGLMSVKDGDAWVVRGFRTKTEGLEHFERGYESFHRRGYEASMSACLNWMFFQASIVRLSLEEIRPLIKGKTVQHGNHVSGNMDFMPLVAERAHAIWEVGVKPRLVRT